MKLFANFYCYFENRRGWLVLGLSLLVLVSCWQLRHLQLEENISIMLPDGDSQVAQDFKLLQQAPFARKLVIHLSATEQISVSQLIAATDQLTEALPSTLFINILSGPGKQLDLQRLNQLENYLPTLADADDLAKIDKLLTPANVERLLQNAYSALLQPQGIALKNKLRRDPFNIGTIALSKLRYLNPVPEVRVEQGHFLSQDRHSSLILADTPIAMTDSLGSKTLLNAFVQARQLLPIGINAELVSGHPYTLANASVIQQDISRLLLASSIGILVLFMLFLGSWRALLVYVLPLVSFLVALLVVDFFYDRVSGITVGFGAVLLGITIDFGLHVYLALRNGQRSRSELLEAVSRPVLFGALTSLVAFAVLLGSELPGQRQLALFSMAGIASAVLFALFFLPQFVGESSGVAGLIHRPFRRHIFDRSPPLRKTVLILWLLIMVTACFHIPDLKINGDLRKLSYQPEQLRKNEAELSRVWGNMRGRTLLFVAGEDLQTALQRNEEVWNLLKDEQMSGLASLAPLLPSLVTQQQRLEDWRNFWAERKDRVEKLLLASGKKYGFSSLAFAPFWENIALPGKFIDIAELQHLGLGSLLENLLRVEKGQYQLISLLPDQPEVISKLDEKLALIPGVNLVSQSNFGRELSAEISADFKHFIFLAGLAVLMLVFCLFRRFDQVFLAMLPVASGLLVMFGGMAWLGLQLNIFNVVASILIIGLGVDYGIFMVCHRDQKENLNSSLAILISGLTTLIGFGALALANHPALYSIGITVLLGIGAAVPTAVLVIPALAPKRL